MFEFIHNAMHPLDLDGLVWAWGQAGAYWRAYWGSWDAWRRGAAAPRSWRWKHNVLGTVRRVFRWRPWSRKKRIHYSADFEDTCSPCKHPYHGQGTDYVRSGDGDETKVVSPESCDEGDCPCLGEEIGTEWRVAECIRCDHTYHGSGHENDHICPADDSDGDEVLICVPSACQECGCLGNDRGIDDCVCDDEA